MPTLLFSNVIFVNDRFMKKIEKGKVSIWFK